MIYRSMDIGHDSGLFPGERFSPMDDELILYYLKPLANEQEVPGRGHLVFEYDLYQEQPAEIWDKFYATRANELKRSNSLYFFCRLKQATPNSKNYKRVRKLKCGGTWIEHNNKKVISPETNIQIGSKKSFNYKKKRTDKSNWFMQEFKLDPSQLLDKNKDNDKVLCVLRKKDYEPGNKRKRQEQEEDDNKEENELSEMVQDHQPQQKRPCLVPFPEADQSASNPTQPTLEASSSIIGNSNPPQVQQIPLYGDQNLQYVSGQVQQITFYGDQNPYGMQNLSGEVQQIPFDGDQNPYGMENENLSGQVQQNSFNGNQQNPSGMDNLSGQVQQNSFNGDQQNPYGMLNLSGQVQQISFYGDQQNPYGMENPSGQVQQISFYDDQQNPYVMQNVSGQVQQIPLYGDQQNLYGMQYLSWAPEQFGGEDLLQQFSIDPSTTNTTNAPLISSEIVALDEEQNQYFQYEPQQNQYFQHVAPPSTSVPSQFAALEGESPVALDGGETNMGVVQQNVPQSFDDNIENWLQVPDEELLMTGSGLDTEVEVFWKQLDEMDISVDDFDLLL